MIGGTIYFIVIIGVDIAIYLMIDSYLDGTWDRIHDDREKNLR